MSLETKIMEDLKEAMKAKDQAAMRGIRAIKSAILLFKTDGSGNELDEAGEIKLLQKLVKQRQDSHDIYKQQNREDLAQVEMDEISVIMRYLPKQLEGEELEAAIKAIIDQTGANSIKDMGKVIGAVKSKLCNQADGSKIALLVKQKLS